MTTNGTTTLGRQITIPQVTRTTLVVTVKGITPLVVHRMDDVTRREMEDKLMGKAVKKRKPVDPEKAYLECIYYTEGDYHGFPCSGAKAAMVRGGKHVGLVMKDLKGATWVRGVPSLNDDREVLEIITDEPPIKRTDLVKIGMGISTLRFRPEYKNWEMEIPVMFAVNSFTDEQIINAINAGGWYAGLGENRPEKGGDWGRFEVVNSRELLPEEVI